MPTDHEQSRILHGIGGTFSRGTKRTAEHHNIYDNIGEDTSVWKQEPSRIDTASTRRPRPVMNPYSSRMSNGTHYLRSNDSNPTASRVVTMDLAQRPAKRTKEASGFDGLPAILPSKYYVHGGKPRESSSRMPRAVPSTVQVSSSRNCPRPGAIDMTSDRQSARSRTMPPLYAKLKMPSQNIISLDESESDAGEDLGLVIPRSHQRAKSESRDEIDLIDCPDDQPSLPDFHHSPDNAMNTSRTRPTLPRRLAKDGESTKRLDDKLRKHIPQGTFTKAQEFQGSPLSSPPSLGEVPEARNNEVEEIEDADGFANLSRASTSRNHGMTPSQMHTPDPAQPPGASVIPQGRVRQMRNEIERRSKTKFISDLNLVGPPKSRINSMKGKNSSGSSSNRTKTAGSQAGVSSRDKHATAPTTYEQKLALPLQLCIWGSLKSRLDDEQAGPEYWLYWSDDASELQLHKHPLADSKTLRRKPVRSIKLSALEGSTIFISAASDFHLIRIQFENNLNPGCPGELRDIGLTFKFLSRHSNIKYWNSLIARLKAFKVKYGESVEIVQGSSARACLESALKAADLAEAGPRRSKREPTNVPQAGYTDSDVVSDADTSVQKKQQPRPRPAHGKNHDIAELFPPRSTRRSSRLLTEDTKQDQEQPPPNLDEIILVYPPSGQGAVNVTNGDLRRLEPSEYLNDTLIELGLKFWLHELREKQPALAESIHVFSPFFFKKLASKGNKTPEDGHKSVRKWTAKVDIFKKKFIIVPINENIHWYLAIIYHPEHILDTALPKPSPRSSKRVSNAAMSRQRKTLKDIEGVGVDGNLDGGPRSRGDGVTDETIASTPATRETDSEAEAEVEGLVVDVEVDVEKSFQSCSLDESQLSSQFQDGDFLSDHVQQLEHGSSGPGPINQNIDDFPGMDVDADSEGVLGNTAIVDDTLSEDSNGEEIDQLDDDDIPSTSRVEEYNSNTPLPSQTKVPETTEFNSHDRTSPMDVDDPATDDSFQYPAFNEAHGDLVEQVNQSSDALTREPDIAKEQDEQHQIVSAVPTTNFYGSSASVIKTYEGRNRLHIEALSDQSKQEDDDDELDILAHREAERESSEDLEVTEHSRTIIFCMDSLGSSHPRALSRLNEYLQEEAKDKKGIVNPSAALTKKALVPAQPNYCDCGLYLLHFAQTFVRDPEKYKAAIFTTKKTSAADRNALWHNDEVGSMREKMKDRIVSESAIWKQEKTEKEQKELENKVRTEYNPENQPIRVEQSDDEIEVSEVRHVGSQPKKQTKKVPQAPPARLR